MSKYNFNAITKPKIDTTTTDELSSSKKGRVREHYQPAKVDLYSHLLPLLSYLPIVGCLASPTLTFPCILVAWGGGGGGGGGERRGEVGITS